MLNEKDLLLHQQRQQELQREAHNATLARELRQTWRSTETQRQPQQTSSQPLRALSRLAALFL